MKVTTDETHLYFTLETNDYIFGRADAFLDDFRRDVPKKARDYDAKHKRWKVLRLYETEFHELREYHFAVRVMTQAA